MSKYNKFILIIMSLFLLLAFNGCSAEKTNLPDVKILGDVNLEESFKEIWEKAEKEKITYKETKIDGVDISKLINTFNPVYDEYNVYLRAHDGFLIKLEMKGLEDTFLAYSNEDGWVYVSDKHPVNSGIKNIDELRIVCAEESKRYDFGLNIVVDNLTYNFTIGQLYEKEYSIVDYSDGISNKDHEGEEYSVEVLKEKKVFKLEELIEEEISNIIVMDESGNYEFISDLEGFVELKENTVNYIVPEEHKVFTNLNGIIVNPPATSVMDTYNDSLYYLEKDTDVMVLFIDGFSYSQYEKYTNDFPDSNIANYEKALKANTIFKPVTNSGFAAMITGKPPIENGVLNRDYRELKVDTIFDEAEKLGKKAAMIEGDIKILNTNIDPILNLDLNNNGQNDDEVYQSALKEIENDNDFLLVHFHGLDDLGHDYGPNGKETIERFKLLDEYVGDLVSRWQGKVIITADHGMHTTADGGNHGEFRSEDLFIPYILINGGQVDGDE